MGDSLDKSKSASVRELLNHAMQEWSYAKMRCTMQAILSMDANVTIQILDYMI